MKKTFYWIIGVVVIGLLAGLYFWFQNSKTEVADDPSLDQPTAVLVQFVNALKNGKGNDAYDAICEYNQRLFSRADYSKWVELRAKIIKMTKYEYSKLKTETNVTLGDQQYEICVTYHLKTESMAPLMGGPQPQVREFGQPVVYENGHYRVYTGQTEIAADIDGFTDLLKNAGK